MLVPKFALQQTEEEVIVIIKVPYIRVGEAEVSVVSTYIHTHRHNRLRGWKKYLSFVPLHYTHTHYYPKYIGWARLCLLLQALLAQASFPPRAAQQ